MDGTLPIIIHLCSKGHLLYIEPIMHKRTFLSLLILGTLSFSACSSSKNTAQLAGTANKGSLEAPAAPQAEEASVFTSVSEKEEVEKEIRWLKMEEAYVLNQKEPRKIFVDVYTDWCGWCKKMDKETFANAAVAEYVNENFYAVKLDAESTREFEFAGEKMTERVVARQMGVSSYPTIVFIHEDFKQILPVPGYQSAKDFKEILVKFKAIDINQKQ